MARNNLMWMVLLTFGLKFVGATEETLPPILPEAMDSFDDGETDSLYNQSNTTRDLHGRNENQKVNFDCSLAQFDTEDKFKNFFDCNDFHKQDGWLTTYCCLEDDTDLKSHCSFSYRSAFENKEWKAMLQPDFKNHIMFKFAPECTQKFHTCLFKNEKLRVQKVEKFSDKLCTELDVYGSAQQMQTQHVSQEEWKECGKKANCVAIRSTSMKKSCIGYSGPAVQGNTTEVVSPTKPPSEIYKMQFDAGKMDLTTTSMPTKSFKDDGGIKGVADTEATSKPSPKQVSGSESTDKNSAESVKENSTPTGVPVWTLPVVGVGSAILTALVTVLIFNRKGDGVITAPQYNEYESLSDVNSGSDGDK